MGEMQIWQYDGLGTDKDTLEKVLRIFRSDGVQGIKSQQQLDEYIRKLDDNCIQEMSWIDAEATLQMLVDCFGEVIAFQKYAKAEGFVKQEKTDSLGWINPAVYKEVTAKYKERIKRANEEKDKILSDYTHAAWKAEAAENQIRELKDTLAHYKADLYDLYAQAGKLPNYERG